MASGLDYLDNLKGIMVQAEKNALAQALVLNDLVEEEYSDAIAAAEGAKTQYLAGYENQYGDMDDWSDATVILVRKDLASRDVISLWNTAIMAQLAEIGDLYGSGVWDETNQYYDIYYSVYNNTPATAWIDYHTPNGMTRLLPALLTDDSDTLSITDDYLPEYIIDTTDYGWFADSDLDTEVATGDTVTAHNGVVDLYTGVPAPKVIMQMHYKMSDGSGGVEKVYPVTYAKAVMLEDGTTLQDWIDNNAHSTVEA